MIMEQVRNGSWSRMAGISCLPVLILLLLLTACSGKRIDDSRFPFGSSARWITDERSLPVLDSLYYLDQPAPLFRKEFNTGSTVDEAKLFITAAGYYKAYMNGEPVGRTELDPAWTDFSKRIYYAEFDVTSLVNNGLNCLGVSLGNGFYNPLPLRKWGHRNLRVDLSVGKPEFIARLLISYDNGESEEILTDGNWKYEYGPLIKNSVYLGVVYDAREARPGWNEPGYDDGSWLPARTGKGPGGYLQKAFFPPVRITREITPVGISSPGSGIYIVDMGVNFTGTFRIRLTGSKGDTIRFRFGERIYEDGSLNPMTTVIGQIKRRGVGGPGAPDTAWQTDSYIFGDIGEDWFSPPFTYHTYRYMEISGLDEKPLIQDIKGLFMHTDIPRENSFSCSAGLLNSIQDAAVRTFRANLVSVQSDCPAREKFGYGGDLNATGESFIYNFNMQAFYRKTIYDWLDAMNDSLFVDTAPFAGISYCGLSWESAYLITQYYLYLYYNDTDIIKELYEQNRKWMDKAARLHPGGLVDSGLSDHESLEPVPVELTGTCHYLQCARIMEEFAIIMGDQDSEHQYRRLADHLESLVREEFWDTSPEGEINRQTLFSTLLYHGIIPEEDTDAAKDSLIEAVRNGPAGHFSTGIFGTKYVLETLSEYGSPEMVYDVVNSTEYPGWGHMIDRGATTIWETWKESDNTYSNCHPMFGTVTEWYYRWLGGIRPDHPGFGEFTLAPFTPGRLDHVSCTYHSPRGKIISNWEKDKKGTVIYEMTIPEGSTANVILPVDQFQRIEINKNGQDLLPDRVDGLTSGKFRLDGGEYRITLSSPYNVTLLSAGREAYKLFAGPDRHEN